jgi:hypothetical protein
MDMRYGLIAAFDQSASGSAVNLSIPSLGQLTPSEFVSQCQEGRAAEEVLYAREELS